MMMASSLGVLICLASVVCLSGQSVVVNNNTGEAINKVDEEFVSCTLDQYLLQDKPKWDTFDFKSDRVRTLLKGLSPGFLRLGGTPADWTVFTPGSQDLYDELQELPPLLTITGEDVDNLADLARSCDFRLLWDLNLQLRYGLDWDPTNAIAIMEYAIAKGHRDIFNFELGNEPNLYGRDFKRFGHMKLNGTQIGRDFTKLYTVMKALNFPGILIGPDTGDVSQDIWPGFIEMTGSFLTAVTFHHYYFEGPKATYKDYMDPKHFDQLLSNLEQSASIVKKSRYPSLPIWIGETSDAYNSGTKDVSDRFVSGFLWLDKLGLSAKHGIKVVMRQDFYAHNYPLIGVDLYPNPDYWLSLLHKRLVGRSVFNVTTVDTSRSSNRIADSLHSSPTDVRVYAHCTRPSGTYMAGALSVFALSVNTSESVQLMFSSDLQKLDVDVYLMTPHGAQGVLSRNVSLNGHPLNLVDDHTLPQLIPVQQSARLGVTLPPLSYGFFVFSKANLDICRDT